MFAFGNESQYKKQKKHDQSQHTIYVFGACVCVCVFLGIVKGR